MIYVVLILLGGLLLSRTAYSAPTELELLIQSSPWPHIKQHRNWKLWDWEIKTAGEKYHVSPAWIKAILLNETILGLEERTRAGDVSVDGLSWGIAQFTLPTARAMLNDPTIGDAALVDKLKNPAVSIDLCGRYLSHLYFEKTGGNIDFTVRAYNQSLTQVLTGRVINGDEYLLRWKRWVSRIEGSQE